jgi:hypothetical protein
VLFALSLVIPGRGNAANPEPMNTDGAGLSSFRVHGFRVLALRTSPGMTEKK